jgi:hypothetical protein
MVSPLKDYNGLLLCFAQRKRQRKAVSPAFIFASLAAVNYLSPERACLNLLFQIEVNPKVKDCKAFDRMKSGALTDIMTRIMEALACERGVYNDC